MKQNKKNKPKEQEHTGAFAAVMVLAAILIVSWFAVYDLFISR